MGKEKFVRVLTCKVAETPKVEMIENTLASLQEFVGGFIEVSYAVEGITMIVNEDGKRQNLNPNFIIRSFDVVVGNVLFIGSADDDFASISDDEILTVIAYLGDIGRVNIDHLISEGLLKQMIESRVKLA